MSSGIIASLASADQRNHGMAAGLIDRTQSMQSPAFFGSLSHSFSSNLTADLSAFERRRRRHWRTAKDIRYANATALEGVNHASRSCIRQICAALERNVPQGLPARNHRSPQPHDFDHSPCRPMFRHRTQHPDRGCAGHHCVPRQCLHPGRQHHAKGSRHLRTTDEAREFVRRRRLTSAAAGHPLAHRCRSRSRSRV